MRPICNKGLVNLLTFTLKLLIISKKVKNTAMKCGIGLIIFEKTKVLVEIR